MAIKIIKQGIKESRVVYPFCYCEFTYEKEDIHEDIINCPCCDAILDAKQYVIGKVDDYPLPTNGEYGVTTNPHGTYPMPIWYNQQVAPDGYKIRDGLNKPLPSRLTTSDNWSGCEGCPNNPKHLKTPYVGDSPCQWCQKSPWKITCTSNVK